MFKTIKKHVVKIIGLVLMILFISTLGPIVAFADRTPVTGIGSQLAGATAGSVLFAGTNGVLSQNNSKFFWDNTNFRLGIGTATPGYTLDVGGTTKSVSTPVFSGAGLNDLTVTGTYTGNKNRVILITVIYPSATRTISTTPTAGGTGYTSGDILTTTCGAQITVNAVSGGAVTSVSLVNTTTYTRGTGCVIGSGQATTGGTGTGATVNITDVVDAFTQSINGKASATPVLLGSSGTLSLGYGLTYTFASKTGHTTGNSWTITITTQGIINAGSSLSLGGSFFAESDTTRNTLVIGTSSTPFYGSGASSVTDRSVVIGVSAGGITGSDSVFLGYNAGNVNSASGQVFIGASAGVANTSGGGNTFVGQLAGEANTTGSSNTFLGQNAGKNTTTGQQNTFLGLSAGNANTTSTGNTFVGYAAGQQNSGTSKDYNTYVGYLAGFQAKGTRNNCFGGSSCYSAAAGGTASGNRNQMFGTSAGDDLTSGSDNIGIGDLASNDVATGNFNISIGTNAGLTTTTGTGNIVIGDNSKGVNFDNTIVLGRSLIATATSQILIGGSSAVAKDMYIGNGVTNATPVGFTLQPTGASGSNIAGVNSIFAAGKGTGTGTPGSIVFQVAALGSSGSTLQSLTTAMTIDGATGALIFPVTITAPATTGGQTINKISGTINFAAGETANTVTDSLVTANSIISVVARTNDVTCLVKNYVPTAGSFVINMTAACTAETSVGFFIINK